MRSQRRPYIASTHAILRQLVKSKNPHLSLHLNELSARLKLGIERIPLTGWKGYKPVRKTHAMLWNIQGRFGDETALVLTATVLGTLLCLKYEPGVLQDHRYAQFQQMRVLASLMKAPPTGLSFVKPYKPRPTGANVVLHLHRLVVNDCRQLLNDLGTTFEANVLRYQIQHPRPQRAIRIIKP